MTRRWRRVAAAMGVAGALLGPQAVGAQGVDPTVVVDRTGTTAGEKMLVTGAGWPEGSTLIVELCGHGGLDGSVDCDVPHQRTAGVGSSGEFSVELVTGLPPKPCPCVVKATDQTSRIAATAPIAVAGLATVPITVAGDTVERSVEISSIDVVGGGRLVELFGAGGRRVLEFTLVNTGRVAIDAPDVSIAWGSGREPSGFVKPPETLPLEPGETQTVTVALDRPAMTIGTQTAIVEITGVGDPVVARASTSAYPWGLVAIALVLFQAVLLFVRNRVRRRVHRSELPRERPAPPVGALPTAAIAALPAGDQEIDLRGADVVDVRDPVVAEPVVVEPSWRNGHDTDLAAAPTIDELTTSAEALHRRVEEQRIRTLAALRQAEQLSEALVAAAEARASEAAVQAERRRAEAQALIAEATDVLDAARAHAGELIDVARRTAGKILARADLEQEEITRSLSAVAAERDELLAAARSSVEEATNALHGRLRGLEEELRTGAAAILRAAAPEGVRPPMDELDRRLAKAMERALTDV